MSKKFIYIFLLICSSLSLFSNRLFAQNKMRPLTLQEIAVFDKSLKDKCDATLSLESVFIQEKNLEMLSKKMVSKLFSIAILNPAFKAAPFPIFTEKLM